VVEYNVNSIVEMNQIDHIRKNSGMYIGSSEDATRLLEEVLDNSLDEVQAGFCNSIGVIIDDKKGFFSIIDNGRGFPFDQRLPLDQDPPIMASRKLFTSGKFNKNDQNSAYQIASGLHGIGLVACTALSNKVIIEIFKNNLHGFYQFDHEGNIKREQSIFLDEEKPFSTKIDVYPSNKYFSNTSANAKHIEERLRIACANFSNLKIAFMVNGEKTIIKGNEEDLILDYLSKSVTEWFNFSNKKGPESCDVKISWDEEGSVSPKLLTTVNLVKVQDGAHVTRLYNILRGVFSTFAKKHHYEFHNDDCLNWLRLYINLKIINASFEAQVKVRLEKKSDLSVMDPIEKQIKDYFTKNEEKLIPLLEKFQDYRKKIQSKKIIGNQGKHKALAKLIKLRDCIDRDGELFICEGDSAAGGLIQGRNPKKHAILPLRGVIPNVVVKKELLKNKEIQEIITAIGAGIENNFNSDNIRYSKVVIICDSDPAGGHISSLLMTFFAKFMEPLIKAEKLFLCETPLDGVGYGKNFVPLWTKEELDDAREANKKIRHFKGLGEFPTEELKELAFGKNRKLIPVLWSDKVDQIFELISDSQKKRQLAQKQWKLL